MKEEKNKRDIQSLMSSFILACLFFMSFVDTSTKSDVLDFVIGQILCMYINKREEKNNTLSSSELFRRELRKKKEIIDFFLSIKIRIRQM